MGDNGSTVPKIPAPPAPPAPPTVPAVPVVPAPPAPPASGGAGAPSPPSPPSPGGQGAAQKPPVPPGTPAAPVAPGGQAPTAPGASAGGSGALLTFAMKAIEQTERKTLVFEYHRQQAVTRQYAPQSLIGLMLDDLSGPGHFLEVDLDDAFFRSLDVEVSLTTGFEAIGLQSVAVALDYGDAGHPQKHRHADLVFDTTRTTPQHWVVPIATDYDLGYTPRIEYHFDPQAGWDAERNEVIVEPGRIEDRTLQLDPTRHVGLLQVEVRPDGLDPLEVSAVEVVLTHTAPGGWVAKRTFPVTPTSAPQVWKLRTARLDPIAYTVELRYTLVEGDPISLPVTTSSATTLVVGSPFADHLERRIDFSIPAGRFTSVVLDLSYDDGAHKSARRVELGGDALAPARVRIGVLDPTKRDTTIQATLLGNAGEVVRGAPFTGAAEFLSIAEDATVTGT